MELGDDHISKNRKVPNTCSVCRYLEGEKVESGKNAPSARGHRQVSHWPTVKIDDWCGEFQHVIKGAHTDVFSQQSKLVAEARVLLNL